MPDVKKCQLTIHGDDRGSLIAVENGKNIPFEIRRVYYIFGTHADVARGFHAHRKLQQMLVATSGSVELRWEYDEQKGSTILNSPTEGLLIEGLVWREMHNFSPDCVLMVLASEYYDEADYIRDYDVFLQETAMAHVMIHPTSDVQTRCIGRNTTIWQFCVVLSGARIGSACNICSHCFIENGAVIGNKVTVKCGVNIWNGVTLEDNVFVGHNTAFCNDRYPKSKNAARFKLEGILVRKGATIGANAVILPGVTIGENALIGAGAIVTKNVPAGSVIKGTY